MTTAVAQIMAECSARARFEALLGNAVPHDRLRRDVPLSTLSRYRIGGCADIVVAPGTVTQLAHVLRAIRDAAIPYVVIGDGSNLLFDDDGLRGVVVHIGRALSQFAIYADGRVSAGAGIWVPSLVRRTLSAGLEGIVHAIGIPGTLGGLCVMNGGSQRKGIGDSITAVDAMDSDGTLHHLSAKDLDFAYRRSRLQDGALVAVAVHLQLTRGDSGAMRREAVQIMAARRAKFPRNRANCGSVFVSNPALYQILGPPGMAIEQAGLKGARIGDAQVSPEHANFIVNLGQAQSRDVLALIRLVRDTVASNTGIAMDAEVRHVDPHGVIRPAHEVAG